MAAKITLTGVIDGRVRKTDQYYAFEMSLGGSPTAPKGLPLASDSIQYTVFVSLKAGNRAHLEDASSEQKWLVQGEVVLDIPVNECPGEIGVIAFQISELVRKEADLKDPIVATGEVATTVESESEVRMVSFDLIHLPEKFEGARLNARKTEPLREWVAEHGHLDKPVDVRVEDGVYSLVDGYRRYVIAGERGFTEIPVRIV